MEGRLIASERVRIGLTQGQLAQLVSVTPATVSRWELGKFEPYGSNIAKLADIFGCSTDYLLGLSDERKPLARVSTTCTTPQARKERS
ncbi:MULTISPECIES: helix-turn-helix domain-containing protein [Atopobium]|mgnify:CR=1 FL=1|uniref:HTH cro/C1-type domain-containing protein n=1 Tax=Atopobium minutum 10063974 TaxID=997872 RepID=N2BVQ1_9ACTN|nr:hypothetical protein HMPREF1091_00231 [Atopobium minutum 10063974]